jgi:hypothetical protein
MSTLDDFLDEDRALIVSMPVRVGFWMSQASDIPGTARDEEKEHLGLERALKMIVKKTDDSRFINDVCEYALVNKQDWGAWRAMSENALNDLPQALSRVQGTLTEKDLKDYKSAIYRIASVVAQAAAEEGSAGDQGREMQGSGLVGRLLDRLSVKTDMSIPDNISEKEKAALQKLLACLKG